MIRDTMVAFSDLARDVASGTLAGSWKKHGEVARAVVDWVYDFICAPHGGLGRSGPVCPATPLAIRQNTFWMAVSEAELPTQSSQVECELLEVLDFVEALGPTTGRAAELRTAVLVLPSWGERSPKEQAATMMEIHARMKPQFVERGYMLGEFFPSHVSEGIRNRAFRPLQSPTPLFVVRAMTPIDLIFLAGDIRFTREYFRRYGARACDQALEYINGSTAKVPTRAEVENLFVCMNEFHPRVSSAERMRDLVTGFITSAYAFARLEQEAADGPVPVVVLRITNDDVLLAKWGRGHRDFVLWSVGKFILNAVRENDLVARFEENEFLVVLGESTPEGWITRFVERIGRTRLSGDVELPLRIEIGYVLARTGSDVRGAKLVNAVALDAT